MTKLAMRVASKFLRTAARFEIDNLQFEDLADAAQEAEFRHAEDGKPHEVVALVSEPGMFEAGEVVYTSKGED